MACGGRGIRRGGRRLYGDFELGLVEKMARKQLTRLAADAAWNGSKLRGEGKLRWGRSRRASSTDGGKKVSRLDRICGSILHAAHVPLTATVCLLPGLASIVSYTLDHHSHHQAVLNGRRSHRRGGSLLDILLDSYSSPLLFLLGFDGSSTSNDELVNTRRARNPKTNRELEEATSIFLR